MMQQRSSGSVSSGLLLGLSIFFGLACLGYLLGKAALDVKELERRITVKGLSEREYPADIVIWPIQFTTAGNDLGSLYETIDDNSQRIKSFLIQKGARPDEITVSAPAITDKSAQQYGNNARAEFRYTALQTVTVYSSDVDKIRGMMNSLSELGKQGIVFNGTNYQTTNRIPLYPLERC